MTKDTRFPTAFLATVLIGLAPPLMAADSGDVTLTLPRIEVASTNFPNYERNLNSGGRSVDETVAHTARTRILHDARNASFIVFATLPR
jgi:hypothetical protein